MAKFYVTMVSKSYHTQVVEAESKADAIENFDWNEVDWTDPENIENDITDVEQIKEEENDF